MHQIKTHAIDKLLLALLNSKIVSGDYIFTDRERCQMVLASIDLAWINEPLEGLEPIFQVPLMREA